MPEPHSWVYSSNTRDIRPYPVNTTGYNAGVKHLNLTRILGRGGWWLEEHRLAFKKYGGNVVWMHQDLLNIIAYHHPEVLLNLPCYTNIRGHTATQCLGTAAAGGGGGSGDAVAMGAGFEAVHGAGYVFAERYKKVKKKTYVPKIFMYEVSRAFQEYDMTRYSRSAVRELAAAVQARLEDAIRGFPAVLDAPPSPPPGALPYNGISQQTPPPPAGGADPEWRGTAERLKRMIVGSILKYADDTALAWQGPAAAATAA